MDILLLPFDGSKTNQVPESEVEASNKSTEKVLPLIEQLTILNGHTSLYWTARAVAQSKRARRILVMCGPSNHEALRAELPDDARFELENFAGNVFFERHKDRTLTEDMHDFHASMASVIQRPIVLVACGRPLLHGKTIDALIDYVQSENLDSAALVISDAVARAAWGDDLPAPHRLLKEPLHYLPLGVVGPQLLAGVLRQNKEFAPTFEQIDEKGGPNFVNLAPLAWKIVRTVGIRLSWKFLLRKATGQDVQDIMAKVFDSRFDFMYSDDANLVLAVGEAKHRARIEELLR